MEDQLIFQIEYPGESSPLYSNVHVANGWCFHTSEPIHSIKLYINGEFASEAILQYPRMDVAADFPDNRELSLLSGFQCYFDPSKLPKGKNVFEFHASTSYRQQQVVKVDIEKSIPAPLKITDVFVDVVGSCNLRCAMCPQGRIGRLVAPKKAVMSVDLFERVVSFLLVKGFIGEYINLYNWGDPLLHPQLDQILEICNEKKLKVIISTNLSVPSYRLKALENHNIELLIVSISGFSQEKYVKNHIGGDFALVKKNLEELANHRDKIKDIVVKYLVFNYNKEELDLAKGFCLDYRLDFGAYAGAIPSAESFFEYLENPDYRRLIGDYLSLEQIKLQPARFCPQETSITINPESGIEMCCVSWNHKHGMSVFDADIHDYLNNKVENDFCAKCLASGYSHYKHFGVIIPQLLQHRLN